MSDTASDMAVADHESAPLSGGLSVSQDGYSLDLKPPVLGPGRQLLELTLTGPDGDPVTRYEVVHEMELHLVVVRRDFTGYQHVHPQRDRQGTWSVAVDLDPGQWRVFADFAPHGGPPLVLATDLLVVETSPDEADETNAEARTADVDGYHITLAGHLTSGRASELIVSVAADGRPVSDLQPYLGAYGHLVALRAGDLAYLHVHPQGEHGDGTTMPGPDVLFHAVVPSRGRYHLYLDFKHGDAVRTATFTVETS